MSACPVKLLVHSVICSKKQDWTCEVDRNKRFQYKVESVRERKYYYCTLSLFSLCFVLMHKQKRHDDNSVYCSLFIKFQCMARESNSFFFNSEGMSQGYFKVMSCCMCWKVTRNIYFSAGHRYHFELLVFQTISILCSFIFQISLNCWRTCCILH